MCASALVPLRIFNVIIELKRISDSFHCVLFGPSLFGPLAKDGIVICRVVNDALRVRLSPVSSRHKVVLIDSEGLRLDQIVQVGMVSVVSVPRDCSYE